MKKKLFKEPSTWAGLSTIALSLSPVFPQFSPILLAVSGVCGGLAVVLREGKHE